MLDGAITINAALGRLRELVDSNPDLFKHAVANVLNGVDPSKPYGTVLFDAIARLSVSVAIEAFALRRGEDGILRVFLRRRAMDDTAYPGEWHAPGSIMRSRETVQDVLDRLRGEFGDAVVEHTFVTNCNWSTEKRGHVLSIIYIVELAGDGRLDDTHGWFDVNALPAPMVDSHRDNMLPMAIEAFEEQEERREQKRQLTMSVQVADDEAYARMEKVNKMGD